MADEQQLALIKQGREVWNEWRECNPLSPVNLQGADLTAVKLRDGPDGFGVNLAGVDLTGANLARANLPFTVLSNANLSGADLSGANLTDARLARANLTDVNLRGATLRDAILREANLTRADLRAANLIRAHLAGANLVGGHLQSANLELADLCNADLSGAALSGADLTNANLLGANLTGAYLVRANLTRAELAGATLYHAKLFETVLADVDLSQTQSLDRIDHIGPSVVDHRTLSRSGELPLAFLQGSGLPDRLIDYLPSLLNAGPIQFSSVFISYSTANEDFAKRLHADLQARGVRCWFAPHDMQGGRKIHAQIDEAIRIYDRLLLILSSESMSSRWVTTEITKAREKEVRLKRDVLFPVALVPFSEIQDWRQEDSDLGEDIARVIRSYFVPDFTGWETDHGRYLASFEKLLASLKSADARATHRGTAGQNNDPTEAKGEAR